MENGGRNEAKKGNSSWMQVLSAGDDQLVSIWVP